MNFCLLYRILIKEITLLYFIFSIYFIFFIILFRKNWIKNQIFEIMPTFIWTALIVLPFILQLSYFESSTIFEQAFGIFFIGFTFLISDNLKVPKWINSKNSRDNEHIIYLVSVGITLLILVVQFYHLFHMPSIPIIEKYLHPQLGIEKISSMREAASKILDVHPIVIYFGQSSLLIVPILSFILFFSRKYILLFSLIAFSIFYAISTTATGPIASMIFVSIFVLYAYLKSNIQKILSKIIGIGMLSVLIITSLQYLRLNYHIHPYADKAETYRQEFSNPPIAAGGKSMKFNLGDYIRRNFLHSSLGEKSLEIKLIASYPFYRIFIVPVEVSHRWYQYFSQKEKIGFYGLTPSSRENEKFRHPSNQVGIWAYRNRWPLVYAETVSAYASADADAYSRWGLLGIIIVSILIGSLRIGIKLIDNETPLSKSVYFSIIAMIAYTMPVGSFFASIVAQGVGLLVFVYILLSLPAIVFKKIGVKKDERFEEKGIRV